MIGPVFPPGTYPGSSESTVPASVPPSTFIDVPGALAGQHARTAGSATTTPSVGSAPQALPGLVPPPYMAAPAAGLQVTGDAPPVSAGLLGVQPQLPAWQPQQINPGLDPSLMAGSSLLYAPASVAAAVPGPAYLAQPTWSAPVGMPMPAPTFGAPVLPVSSSVLGSSAGTSSLASQVQQHVAMGPPDLAQTSATSEPSAGSLPTEAWQASTAVGHGLFPADLPEPLGASQTLSGGLLPGLIRPGTFATASGTAAAVFPPSGLVQPAAPPSLVGPTSVAEAYAPHLAAAHAALSEASRKRQHWANALETANQGVLVLADPASRALAAQQAQVANARLAAAQRETQAVLASVQQLQVQQQHLQLQQQNAQLQQQVQLQQQQLQLQQQLQQLQLATSLASGTNTTTPTSGATGVAPPLQCSGGGGVSPQPQQAGISPFLSVQGSALRGTPSATSAPSPRSVHSAERIAYEQQQQATTALPYGLSASSAVPQPQGQALAPAVSAFLGSVPSWLLSSQSGTIKVVLTSGGQFVEPASGPGSGSRASASASVRAHNYDYSGGETRLVTLPVNCDMSTLAETVARVSGLSGQLLYVGSSSNESQDARVLYESGGSGGTPAAAPYRAVIRYRLPSDPRLWVDLLDDEDVQLMFDEWAEFSGGRRSSPKLHLYIQWVLPGHHRSGSDATVQSGGPMESSSTNVQRSGAVPASNLSLHVSRDLGQVETVPEVDESASSAAQEREKAAQDEEKRRREDIDGTHKQDVNGESDNFQENVDGRHRQRKSLDIVQVVEKMELIMAEDITLVRFLGSGGYGDVYLGRWHSCEVAVKCLSPSLFFSGGGGSGSVNFAAIADLIREADLLGSLRHPNIVWVYGLVLPDAATAQTLLGARADGKPTCGRDVLEAIAAGSAKAIVAPGALRPPALVVEFMAGGSLKGALARKADMIAGPITRLMLAMDTAKGMAYLHAKNIIHFDLKSANLLLGHRDKRPVCKVADFGLSKQKFDTYVSGVTSQRGTLPYTAPEVIRTPDRVTEKADVFSFGIILWELWTGREPYENLNYHALMHQLSIPGSHVRPPLPGTPDWEELVGKAEGPAEIVPGWSQLVQRCWADDPNERPPFTDVLNELRTMTAKLKAETRASGTRRAVPQARKT